MRCHVCQTPQRTPEPDPRDFERVVPRLLHRLHPHMRERFFQALKREFCLECGEPTRGRPCTCKREE